ncbi:hypothetical protein DXG01_013331 [Tephrocybe rancida]|nr:hypothetical protein DXG01_013331 [Tephrocybe rancida]
MRFGAALLSLVLPLAALAHPPHGEGHAARHQQLAKRAAGDVELHKRFSGARWTFYDVGLGACGKFDVASNFIVALNSAQYGGGYPGPNCFKTITMTYNGKTTTATIKDECPGCPYGGLDLSRGLFQFFASEDKGVLYGEWHFNDGSDAPDPQPTTTKKTTTWWKPDPTTTKKTSTWKPEPTSTWKPEPTTTWKPETTSSKPESSTHSTSTSSKESTSSKPSSTSSESKATPTPTPAVVQQPLSNLQNVNKVFGALGGIAVAGAAA